MSIRLIPLGANVNELRVGEAAFLFSYQTLVAAHLPGDGYFKDGSYYSVTTSRHMNKFIGGADCKRVTQADLEQHLQYAARCL